METQDDPNTTTGNIAAPKYTAAVDTITLSQHIAAIKKEKAKERLLDRGDVSLKPLALEPAPSSLLGSVDLHLGTILFF